MGRKAGPACLKTSSKKRLGGLSRTGGNRARRPAPARAVTPASGTNVFWSFFSRKGLLAVPLLAAGCAAPPPAAFVAANNTDHALPLGRNDAGESCTQDGQPGDAGASVYCGTWEQPSARIAREDAPGATLSGVMQTSTWRDGLERRMSCEAPQPATVLGRYQALVLSCTTRLGGWPQVAMATQVDGHIWLADGVRPALPAMERSIGLLSGTVAPNAAAAQPVSTGLTARRLAASTYSSTDINHYETLIRTANRANVEGNYAAAETALRAAAALQERVQGAASPALSKTYASEALQLSDQGRFATAEVVFAHAGTLAASPAQNDRVAVPLLLQYRGLHQLNENHPAEALGMLTQAEREYAALLPPSALSTTSNSSTAAGKLDNQQILTDQSERRALLGVIETRRAEARAERMEAQLPRSQALYDSAAHLANARGLDEPQVAARLYRTLAFTNDAVGEHDAALDAISRSAEVFGRALPGSRTYAETTLVLAARLIERRQPDRALLACREAASILRAEDAGTSGTLLMPCLALLHGLAASHPDQAQARYAEMFETGQLARGSVTAQQIALASARLAENARDPRVATLIRAHDDQAGELAELFAQRDGLRGQKTDAARTADAKLATDITALQGHRAETEAALQAASPNYGQLVQQVVSAADVMRVLHPGEAFAATMMSQTAGWTFLMRDGTIYAAPIEGGSTAVAALVGQVRHSMDAEIEPPPPFDIAAAQTLYSVVLGGVSQGLAGATSLSVVPTGPLLSLPFGVLLTGPATQDNLAGAPWLINQVAVEHVPAPANFVSLRKLAGTTRATRPWFGFGAFRPVTLAQAERSFPAASCADSAQLLANLPPLPGAERELHALQRVIGAGRNDLLEGAAFTAAGVEQANLKDVRILHFATHALLPTDLRCQNEPALVTSPPPGAKDASGALLTASDVAGLDLDADAVVLSACNTGGPANGASGESLTGLARSFFYAGARALLVTHWSVNDRSTAYLVALTLSKTRTQPGIGLAGALALAQRRVLSEARGDTAIAAHPFYWAALAVIGEGMGTGRGVGS